jgi:MFS family permease
MKPDTRASFKRKTAWLVLLLLVLVGLAIVIAPVWIIQPFKPQTERGIAAAFVMRRWSPVITVVGLIAALVLTVWLWGAARGWWRKAFLVVALIPLMAATWFARQNHFEWMFNPLPNPLYAKAGDAQFINEDDIVLAVERNGEAVAYPVRFMAYHHLVQDKVGDTPIVATY